MDLRQIEYFCQAARAGSFSAAAKLAFVTQQTLSASVASLEHEWGAPLFHRARQGIQLTEFGQAVLPRCEALLVQAQELDGFARQQGRPAEQAATFAYASASLRQEGKGFTLQGLADFRAAHPEIDLQVFELTSDACLAALEDGSVNMAFVVGEPDPARFTFTKLKDARLLVALPAAWPLAQHETVSFRDLAGVPVFPVPDLKISYQSILAGFERYGLKPNFAPVPFSLENAQRFVREGEGVDFSPEHNAEHAPEGIVYRPLTPEDAFVLPLGLAEKRGVSQNPAITQLKAFIEAC